MTTKTKLPELHKLLTDSEQALRDYITYKGQQYPMNEWVTITEYCNRFGIANTQTVTNWIQRGIVPKENVVTIEEYNNIRLIKAVPYNGT
jgi:hypothetical protein